MACRKLILAQIKTPTRVCQLRGISTGLLTGAKQTDLQTETHTGQVICKSSNSTLLRKSVEGASSELKSCVL